MSQEVRAAIPEVWQIIFLALKGSAGIWFGAFFLGFLLVAVVWVLDERRRRKKG